jgi:hypothetical protein
MEASRDAYRRLLSVEAERFATAVAEGAVQASVTGPYEVRFVKLPPNMRGTWNSKRMTLSNHIEVGAYAVVLQDDGGRWLWTTSRGVAQVATLQRWTRTPVEIITADTYEALHDRVHRSMLEGMEHASIDGRSRRATAIGFDFDRYHARREQLRRFERWADGLEPVSEDELEAYLQWWEFQVEPRLQRMVGGIPVDRNVYRMAERRGLVDRYRLVANR